MNSISKKLCLQKRQGSLFMCFVCVASISALFSNSAIAAVWLFDPKISLKQGYDDNFRLSTNSSQEDEVWISELSGELALRGKSERLDVEALLRLDAVKYNGDDSDLKDRNNQLIGLSSRYKVTERNAFIFKGNYFRDTILRTAGIFLDPQDIGNDNSLEPDQDVDGNIVRNNVRRTRFTISPGWRYHLNEKTTLGLNYNYNDIAFSGDAQGLVESDRQKISAIIIRKVTEKDKVTAKISEAYFRPETDQDVDTFEARLGWIHDFSETLRMDYTFGWRDSDFDNSEESGDSGYVANIGATKHTGLTTYRVNLERRVTPSASGNQVEVDQITLDIRRDITEKIKFSLEGRYFDTESTGDSSLRSDRELISLEPRLSWRFLPSWIAGVSYRYRERDFDNGGSGDSNSAFIRISYSPPRQFKAIHKQPKF